MPCRLSPRATFAVLAALGATLLLVARGPSEESLQPTPDPVPRPAEGSSATRPAHPALAGQAPSGMQEGTLPVGGRRDFWTLVEDGETGLPIGGALVEATLPDGSSAHANSGPNGLAILQGIESHPKQVVALAEGYAPAFADWAGLHFNRDRTRIELMRARSQPLLVVARESGAPVAHARLTLHETLWVQCNRHDPTVPLLGAVSAGVTDGNGRAEIPVRLDRERSDGFILEVQAKGRRTTWWAVDDGSPVGAEPWTLRIPAGGSIIGQVLDPKGVPLEGVSLAALGSTPSGQSQPDARRAWSLDQGPHPISAAGYAATLTAVSDEQGRYEIEGIALGEPYSVRVSKPGFAPVVVRDLCTAPQECDIPFDTTLHPEGRLVVRLVDAAQRPVPLATVHLCSGSPHHSLGAQVQQADAQGLATFCGLTAGPYSIEVQGEVVGAVNPAAGGHEPLAGEQGRTLQVRSGETTRIDVTLPRGAQGRPQGGENPTALPPVPVRGVVVDRAGRPLPDIVVRDEAGAPLAVTGPAGEFYAEVVASGGVTVGPNGPYTAAEAHAPPADGSPLRIMLSPRHVVGLRLWVRCLEGAPPPRTVRAFVTPDGTRSVSWRQPLPAGAAAAPWPLDDSRCVLIEFMARPGLNQVRVQAEGFLPFSQDVDIPTTAEAWDATCLLERGHVAEGRVVDDAGTGVAKALVEIEAWFGNPAARLFQSTTTNPDGSFEIGGLCPGPWIITVTHPDYESGLRWRDAEEPSDAQGPVTVGDFVLRRLGRVRVKVTTVDGHPRAYVSVAFERLPLPGVDLAEGQRDPGSGTLRTNVEGMAEIWLEPGRWVATIPDASPNPGHLVPPREFEVALGAATELWFLVPPR